MINTLVPLYKKKSFWKLHRTIKDSGTPTPLSGAWMDFTFQCEMVNREMGLQKAPLPRIGKLLTWVQSFSEAPLGTCGLQTITPHLGIRPTDGEFKEGQNRTTQIRWMCHWVSEWLSLGRLSLCSQAEFFDKKTKETDCSAWLCWDPICSCSQAVSVGAEHRHSRKKRRKNWHEILPGSKHLPSSK